MRIAVSLDNELKKLHKACSQKDWSTTATQKYLLLSTSVHRKYLYFSYSSYRSVTEAILTSYMPALLPPALLTTSTVPTPRAAPKTHELHALLLPGTEGTEQQPGDLGQDRTYRTQNQIKYNNMNTVFKSNHSFGKDNRRGEKKDLLQVLNVGEHSMVTYCRASFIELHPKLY